MVSQTKGSDAIDKPTPGRPHIILHTLPSLSFSTPTQSFNVQFSIRSPLDEKMATPHHAHNRPPSAPSSTHTFGVAELRPAPAQGRSSPQDSLGSSIGPVTLSENVRHLYDLVGGLSNRQDYMQRSLDTVETKVNKMEKDITDMRKDIDEMLQYMREQRARSSGHARRPSVSTPDLHEGTGRRRRLLSAASTISHRAIDNIRSAFGRIQNDAHDALQQLDEEENAMAEASGSLTQQQRAALLDQPIQRDRTL
ncbi:hypothetical protein C8Q79DRAFT_983820 [Trametes meyenii]|nr:hypothetical protein C8Q79DRAFT_983820 [Trametes meyenii]